MEKFLERQEVITMDVRTGIFVLISRGLKAQGGLANPNTIMGEFYVKDEVAKRKIEVMLRTIPEMEAVLSLSKELSAPMTDIRISQARKSNKDETGINAARVNFKNESNGRGLSFGIAYPGHEVRSSLELFQVTERIFREFILN